MTMLRPLSAKEASALELQRAALDECARLCRPGVSLKRLANACSQLAAGSQFRCDLVLHGHGLGDDPPLILPRGASRRMLDWTIQDNETFVIKPVVSHPDGTLIQCGGVVAATPGGARPLGARQPAIDVFSP